MQSTLCKYLTCALLCAYIIDAHAIVLYDEGRLEINGIQLFQDSKNPNEYYYLPNVPSLAADSKGDYEFLCLNYVGNNLEQSGGLFHALVEYSLSQENIDLLSEELRKTVPNAVIMGPVELQEDYENSNPSFRIVSSVLSNGQDSLFKSSTITSGKAPFLPGSKAAISSLLNTTAASLLWESFETKTSDVSIVIEGCFDALVSGYKATISANLELVFDHFANAVEIDLGTYQKYQIENVLDSMATEGLIKIEIVDLSNGSNVNTQMYDNVLNILTDKVTRSLFDMKDSRTPNSMNINTSGQSSKPNSDYTKKVQMTLKQKSKVQSFVFNVTLNQNTSIKVPVYSAGNIGGFFNSFKDDKRYFNVVDLEDPSFQSRDLHFQINGSYFDCFDTAFDNASVRVRKTYSDTLQNSFERTLRFNKTMIDSGEFIQKCNYSRLGEDSPDWLSYEYMVAWQLNDLDTTITMDWRKANSSSLSINPPLQKKQISFGIDNNLLKENGIKSIRIRFGIKVAGQTFMKNLPSIRQADNYTIDDFILYHDVNEPIVYQIDWYTKGKVVKDDMKLLDSAFLFLIPQTDKQ